MKYIRFLFVILIAGSIFSCLPIYQGQMSPDISNSSKNPKQPTSRQDEFYGLRIEMINYQVYGNRGSMAKMKIINETYYSDIYVTIVLVKDGREVDFHRRPLFDFAPGSTKYENFYFDYFGTIDTFRANYEIRK